jgi:uncharacterized surface protein with fasciclin (FAS1) repeats
LGSDKEYPSRRGKPSAIVSYMAGDQSTIAPIMSNPENVYQLSFVALSFSLGVYSQTIVEAAVSNKDFSTLVTALKAADLVGALSGEGPFTVFAPNNDAFAKIDSETLANLLKPENLKALTNILTYHVVSGKLMASDVASALKSGYGKAKLTALNGQTLTARSKDGKIFLEDSQGNMSQIIATDVAGTNGVIHVISSVVMPE